MNLANTIAYSLPGRAVYAPDNPTKGIEIALDRNNLIEDIRFLTPSDLDEETGTYRVMRKPAE